MEVKNLRAYLANIGMTLKEFAKRIDCNYPHLTRILSGYCYPSRGLARDIYEATGGVIRLETRKELEKTKEQESKRKHQTSIDNGYISISVDEYKKIIESQTAMRGKTMMTHYDAFDEHKQD